MSSLVMVDNENQGSEITLHIKSPKHKEKKTVICKPNILVTELKDLVGKKYEVTAGEVSLIFSGKIMKDNDTLDCYHIQDGSTIYMVLRSKTGASTAGSFVPSSPQVLSESNIGSDSTLGTLLNPQGLSQNPEMMDELLNNPLIQDLVSNPENIRMFLGNNPQIRDLMDRNPEVSHILNNPEVLRRSLELARNPAMLQELMRSHDRAISNLESLPGGYSALQRMYRDIQQPMLDAATEQNNPFSGLFGLNQGNENPQQGTENRDPLPNPWSAGNPNTNVNNPEPPQTPLPSGNPQMVNDFLSQFQQILTNNTNSTNPLQSFLQNIPNAQGNNEPPEDRYRSQLDTLAAMGFPDQQANLTALIAAFGDVNGAIERLLNNPN